MIVASSERLILRTPQMGDVAVLARLVNNYRIASRLVRVTYPNDPKETKRFIGQQIRNWRNRSATELLFVLVNPSNKSPMGVIGIDAINRYVGSGVIGFWLGEPYWDSGYMAEALRLVIDYAFSKMNLRRLEAHVFHSNNASLNVLQKSGFRVEGLKIKSARCLATNRIHDEWILGLLKSSRGVTRPKNKQSTSS